MYSASMTNRIILGHILWIATATSITLLAWFSPGSVPVANPIPKPVAHSQAYNRDIAELAQFNAMQVPCPSFWDAPLGNKPCPAQMVLDQIKANLQSRIDKEY